MKDFSDIKKSFENSLRRANELIDGIRSGRDRIKTGFDPRLETVRFGRVDWTLSEEFFEEPYVIIRTRSNE